MTDPTIADTDTTPAAEIPALWPEATKGATVPFDAGFTWFGSTATSIRG